MKANKKVLFFTMGIVLIFRLFQTSGWTTESAESLFYAGIKSALWFKFVGFSLFVPYFYHWNEDKDFIAIRLGKFRKDYNIVKSITLYQYGIYFIIYGILIFKGLYYGVDVFESNILTSLVQTIIMVFFFNCIVVYFNLRSNVFISTVFIVSVFYATMGTTAIYLPFFVYDTNILLLVTEIIVLILALIFERKKMRMEVKRYGD